MTDAERIDRLRAQLTVLAEVARLAADTLDALVPNSLTHQRDAAQRDAAEALDCLRTAIQDAEEAL
jgi:hypothetical protein